MLQRLRNRIATGEREGGFTLIELLVVLIIIAVLLAIAIPSYLGFRARAEQRTAEANIRAAVPAAEAYYQDNGTYAGMTPAALIAIDAGLSDDILVDSAGAAAYCIETAEPGNAEASYAGPGGDVVNTLC
jgi:prepilin-type N-terminal cleavage/methylation domain-containing protein